MPDGIAYESSKRPGTVAIVPSCENNQAIDVDDDAEPEHMRRLVSVAHQKVRPLYDL
jgi:hypothetical protein